jgi:rhamnosyltransferase
MHASPDTLPPVCTVIVTFEIGDFLYKVVDAIQSQTNRVIIVDNGSGKSTGDVLSRIEANRPSNVAVIRNSANLGIAAAMNIGVRKAIENGFEWILTLDHDSIAGPRMVENLLATFRQVSDMNPGIISPVHIDQGTGREYRYVQFGRVFFRRRSAGDSPLRCGFCLSSGSLIRKEVFDTVGFFNEDYFLYAVDNEFCRRVIQNGYDIFVSGKAVLYHREGSAKEVRAGIFELEAPKWTAYRLYYIFRNIVHEMRQSAPISSRLYNFLFLVKTWLAILAGSGSERKKSLSAAARGIRDGMKGKLGKAEEA